MKKTASCACGSLRVHVDAEPLRVSMCHCYECQKRTGSTYGAQARFPVASTRFEGASKTFVRKGDTGKTITFHFCPDCGSTVYWQIAEFPDFVAVAIGGFADKEFPAPTVSVYEARKHAWTIAPDGAEHMD